MKGKLIKIIKLPATSNSEIIQILKTLEIQETTYEELLNIPLPARKASSVMVHAIYKQWNHEWISSKHTLLHNARKDIYTIYPSKNLKRQEQVLITRMLISHSALTHSHIYKKEEPRYCETCNVRCTLEHIIVNCQKFQEERLKFKINPNIKIVLNTKKNQSSF